MADAALMGRVNPAPSCAALLDAAILLLLLLLPLVKLLWKEAAVVLLIGSVALPELSVGNTPNEAELTAPPR